MDIIDKLIYSDRRKNWLKTDFTIKGLLVRVTIDLLLSNLGFFLGILTTVSIWIFSWQVTPQTFFKKMFFDIWLPNIPLLTFSCLFSYIGIGLYRGTQTVSYVSTIFMVGKAVGIASFLFLSLLFMTGTFMPRSTVATTPFFIFTLILSVRLLWTAFSMQYKISPASFRDPQIEKINRKLALLAQQDGWTTPESLTPESAWPYFEDDEVLAAATVLHTGKINQWSGKEVEKFQEEFAAACNVKHAIALSNGTVALELAIKALGIGPGDEVIVTPRTFIASASCVALQGAKPVFADVDFQSQNIDAAAIREAITPRTKAIITVHLAGWPCEMDSIMRLAHEHDLKVVEDCAQAHGARYKGKPVGCFGHAAAFSFCQDKIMTTGGEGGMLLTNDENIWSFSWAYKDHGKSYDAIYKKQHPPGYRWIHESFGTNWRMTEMQAAIGRVQLRKLSEWTQIRNRNANILTKAFSDIPALRVTIPPDYISHAYYKYYVFIKPEMMHPGWDRERVIIAINAEGIPCFTGSCSEIYLEKAFNADGMRPQKRLPVAEELGNTSLMFLVHPTLSEKDMLNMVKTVEKIIANASK
ncbi:MAG: hypothetical protein QG578_1306 [Thermodesulfobacteriota bacterium]|nr:hypothetical protein [Thermodesulfobacteriota bacterium]